MMFLRSQLLLVYKSLDDSTKNKWGAMSGYNGYRPLYNYLTRAEGPAKKKVLDGLISALGNDYESTIKQVLGINIIANVNAAESNITPNLEYKLDNLNLSIKDVSVDLHLCRNINLLKECKSTLEKFLKMTNNSIENLQILSDFASDNEVD